VDPSVTTRRPGWQNAFGDERDRRISVQSAIDEIDEGGARVGSGPVQVVLLLVATVVGLPCFFFTLLALLDHFEQRLTAETPARVVPRPAPVVQVVHAEEIAPVESDSELVGAAIVELPTPFAPSSSPAAATG
jgi:hypothetical protein